MIHLIETIYSNEKEGSDGTGRSQTTFRMPKNIRQVGKGNSARKIYVEDYVMTYIKQLSGGDSSGCKLAVLVGQCIKIENCRNIFISGAVEISDVNNINDIAFTNDTWGGIYEEIKKYFIETEIVGWYLGGPGYLLAEEDKILKLHIDNFAGKDKVLLTYDSLEKEETFLSFENNKLSKQDGYYIYYEKNEEMQNYIIDHKNPQSNEVDYNDKVSKEIRTVIQNKKPVEEESKSVTKLMYAAGTLLAVIVLIVGAAMLRNYDQMKSMQDTLNYLSKNMEEVQSINGNADKVSEDGQAAKLQDNPDAKEASGEDSLDVEVIPGNVDRVVAEDSNTDMEDNEEDDSDGAVSDKELAEDKEAPVSEENKEDTEKSTKTSKADTKDKAVKESGSKTAKNEVKYYVVVDGDTLADISYKLYQTYTKVKAIMELNNITDQDIIYSGQKLKVP